MLRVLYPDNGPTLLLADPATGTVTLYDRAGAILNQLPYSREAVDQALTDARTRIEVEHTNTDQVHAKIRQAIAADLAYLAAGTPTAATLAKQVASLTRQAIGQARLELGDLNSTDGT